MLRYDYYVIHYIWFILKRRFVTLVMAGRIEGMDLEIIENKDLTWLTGQTSQDLNRMFETGIKRKPRKEHVIGDPELIDQFHQFLMENSSISNREQDSQLVDGTEMRNRYLNDSKSVLFEQFLQKSDKIVSETSLWRLMNKPRFKLFKMPLKTHVQHAVCSKCSEFRLLKDSIYNSELSSYIDPKQFPTETLCDEPRLGCYTDECFQCSKNNFRQKLLEKFEDDDSILDQMIEYAFIKSDNTYDTANTSIRNFITNNVPDMLFGMGNCGTKTKFVNHLKRAEETEAYHKFVFDQMETGDCIVAHMDYAMELTRDVARETQDQHYKKKGWPILGIIDYLPDKSKIYRYFIGEVGQSKSHLYTKQGLLQRNNRVKELIEKPEDIKRAFILNDGACNEFWCKDMMAEYPDIFMDLKRKFPNLEDLYVSKFAAGHGKGEIDAS